MGLLVLRQLSVVLPAAELGTYLAAISLSTVLPRLLDFGIPNTGLFYLRNGRMHLRRYAWVGLVALTAAVPLGAAAIVVLGFLGQLAAETATFLAAHFMPLVMIFGLEYVLLLASSAALARSNYAGFSMLTCCTPLLLFGLLTMGIAQNTGFTAAYALGVYLVAACMTAAISMGLMIWLVFRNPSPGSALAWGECTKYAASSYGSGVMKVMAQRADRLILIGFLTPSAYALFIIALTVRDALQLPGNAFSTYMRNHFMDLLKNVPSDRSRLVRSYLLACGFAFAVLLIGGGVFAIIADWLPLYALAPSFEEALPTMRWLVVSVAPLSIFAISQSFLYSLPALRNVLALNAFAALSLVSVLLAAGQTGADLVLLGQLVVGWSFMIMLTALGICLLAARRNTTGKDVA